MRSPFSTWSRCVNGLFDAPRAIAPLRRAQARRRPSTDGRGSTPADIQILESRQLLSAITFADFSSTAGLNLEGAATAATDSSMNHVLRLTPATNGTTGALWAADQIVVAGNFQTTFQFKLATATGGADGSDGFAFVIQNSSPTELRGSGGNLGYDGLTNSLAVQFDTFQNSESSDPSQSYISVHSGGTGANGVNNPLYSLGSYDTVSHGFILDNAQVHTVKIAYTSGTMSIYLDNLTTPVLTVAVDLNSTLGLTMGHAWVGFTGASGGTPMNQDILNWNFSGDDNVVVAEHASVIEGATGTQSTMLFTLDRVGDTSGPLTVNWSTADGTAQSSSDYVAASGSVVFAAGQSQQTVGVTVNGDATPEVNETFKLVLVTDSGVNGTSGQGTILNDDTTMAISNSSAIEGGHDYRFTDNLVAPDASGLSAGRNILVGPADGNIYLASHDTDVVKVFDPKTGLLLRDLSTPGGELDGPWGMVFGPDGGLYVGGKYSQNIVRFDVGTGASTVFVSTASGGLGIPRGLVFGPDGNLYASSHVTPNAYTTDTVKRYNGTTGAYLGDFVTAGSGGLNDANGVAFGPDGNLFVASNLSNEVKRYNGQTGAFINNFVPAGSGGLAGPRQLLFPGDGNLYVAGGSGGTPQVFRYNATTGAFVDMFASCVTAANTSAGGMAFAPNGEFYVAVNTPTTVSGSYVARFAPSSMAAVTVTLSTPVAVTTTVDYATASNGSAVVGSDYTTRSGTMTFAPGETSKTVLVSTLDDTIQENNETFVTNLSNASLNAVITTSQGTATIHDNDVTKFLVVNDGTTDRTYDYALSGSTTGNTGLASTDTAPRGMASNAAGTTTWVVDLNKTVYVYSSAGALLGSWSAGGLKGTATLDGLATNGTDIWLLDSKNATVYRYTGAASRLSGSQSAASSFALNSGNSNGKGIVTDGTSLWVVNDGNSNASDKVFKYTLTGSLRGSWTIDAANAHPTGLTIDPNNVSNIWIVDSTALKVFQYNAATSRISGSQGAAASFALAPGNTNPQDIADPPVVPPTAASNVNHGHAFYGVGVDQADGDFLTPDAEKWTIKHSSTTLKPKHGRR